jgi:hypothetical protein
MGQLPARRTEHLPTTGKMSQSDGSLLVVTERDLRRSQQIDDPRRYPTGRCFRRRCAPRAGRRSFYAPRGGRHRRPMKDCRHQRGRETRNSRAASSGQDCGRDCRLSIVSSFIEPARALGARYRQLDSRTIAVRLGLLASRQSAPRPRRFRASPDRCDTSQFLLPGVASLGALPFPSTSYVVLGLPQ